MRGGLFILKFVGNFCLNFINFFLSAVLQFPAEIVSMFEEGSLHHKGYEVSFLLLKIM